MATTSWQAGAAGGTFLIGTLVQGMIAAYQPSYIPKRWQGTLFVFAIAAIEGIVNVAMVNQLPRIQKIMMFPHGLGWIAVVVVLWVLAPHATAKEVFVDFTSLGWENMGLSVMVGQVTSVYFLILSDSAAHLAEEVKSASKSVPRAMMWSFYMNALVGFIVLISFLFAIPSVDNLLNPVVNPSGYGFIYVLQQASYKGAIPIVAMVTVVMLTGSIDANASTSRQTFAFARDGGLPFGNFLSAISQTRNSTAPRNAVLVTCIITCLLALINIGSSVAFNAIISLQLMALMATYSISIGCVLYQRTLGGSKHLPIARWSLGKWGVPINTIAFVYSIFIFFWTGWPGAANPTVQTFNWSVVMFGGIAIISGLYYFFHGRHHYKGPVALVRET
jgi:choline transport protein